MVYRAWHFLDALEIFNGHYFTFPLVVIISEDSYFLKITITNPAGGYHPFLFMDQVRAIITTPRFTEEE